MPEHIQGFSEREEEEGLITHSFSTLMVFSLPFLEFFLLVVDLVYAYLFYFQGQLQAS